MRFLLHQRIDRLVTNYRNLIPAIDFSPLSLALQFFNLKLLKVLLLSDEKRRRIRAVGAERVVKKKENRLTRLKFHSRFRFRLVNEIEVFERFLNYFGGAIKK